MATYDLRGDYTATVAVPQFTQRSVVVWDIEVDFAGNFPVWSTLAEDLTGLAQNETVSLLHIPAGTTVLGVTATVTTASGDAATLDLGDAGLATRYATDLAADGTALTTFTTGQSRYYVAADDLILKNSSAGATTINDGVLAIRVVAVPA